MDATPRRTASNQVDNHSITPRSRAETFLGSLPVLSLAELPEDHEICPVCIEPYRQPGEIPVLLSCGHVMGKDCLLEWLQSPPYNCPMCRAVLFEHEVAPPHSGDNIVADGYRRRLQEDLDHLLDVMNQAPHSSLDVRIAALQRYNRSVNALMTRVDRREWLPMDLSQAFVDVQDALARAADADRELAELEDRIRELQRPTVW